MTARGPRKATSRMSGKVESDGGQSMFLSRKFQGTTIHEGVFFLGRSPHAARRPRIGFSRFNPPHRVCPGCPTLLRQLGSHCRGVDGDGEMGREQTRPGGFSRLGVSLVRSVPSCKGMKDKPVPVVECIRFTKKRSSACREARSCRDLPQTQSHVQGTHSLPRPRLPPRPTPRPDPPRRPPERREVPAMLRAAPC